MSAYSNSLHPVHCFDYCHIRAVCQFPPVLSIFHTFLQFLALRVAAVYRLNMANFWLVKKVPTGNWVGNGAVSSHSEAISEFSNDSAL